MISTKALLAIIIPSWIILNLIKDYIIMKRINLNSSGIIRNASVLEKLTKTHGNQKND